MKKLRAKEVNWQIQYHPVSKYKNWYLNPGLTPQFMRKMTYKECMLSFIIGIK